MSASGPSGPLVLVPQGGGGGGGICLSLYNLQTIQDIFTKFQLIISLRSSLIRDLIASFSNLFINN